MLVQSSSGKVYAVLANNDEYELGVLPEFLQISTTVFLSLRCRYRALKSDTFNPLLVPKPVLVGGIERSKNTLRGVMVLNTGFSVNKIGKGFPEIAATKLVTEVHAQGILVGKPEDGECLSTDDVRTDFVEHFAQLVESAIGPVFPPKDFSGCPDVMTPFDLHVFAQEAAETGTAPLSVIPDKASESESTMSNVTKIDFTALSAGQKDDLDTESGSEWGGNPTGDEGSPS